MKRKKLLELGINGVNYDFKVPKGTQVNDLQKALAFFIIESSKYRQIKSSTFLMEINQWVQEIENNL